MSSVKNIFDPGPEEFEIKIFGKYPKKWVEFKEALKREIVGQERAIDKITDRIMIVEHSRKTAKSSEDPLAFLGAPGTGKSETVEQAAYLWLGRPAGGRSPLVSIAGEDYQESHTTSTLLGAPSGYIGYGKPSPLEELGSYDAFKIDGKIQDAIVMWWEEKIDNAKTPVSEHLQSAIAHYAGVLTEEKLKEFEPFRSVLRVDEFEKMHFNVQKIFLGILNDGKVALRNGEVVDFRGCLIVFTGNIGSGEISKYLDTSGSGVGFELPVGDKVFDKEKTNQKIYDIVKKKTKEALIPELYDRVGKKNIVAFHTLGKEGHRRVAEIQIRKLRETYSGATGIGDVLVIKTTDEFIEFLLDKVGANESARTTVRLVKRYMRDPLVRGLASGEVRTGDVLLFTVEDGKDSLRRMQRITYKPEFQNNPSGLIVIRDLDGESKPEFDFALEDKELFDDIYNKLNEQFHEFLIAFSGDRTPQLEAPKDNPEPDDGYDPDDYDFDDED